MAGMKEGMNSAIKDALKGCYGSHIHPSQVKEWLVDNIMENMNRNPRITLNIWGAPGCSKTDVVKSLAHTPVEWNGRNYE